MKKKKTKPTAESAPIPQIEALSQEFLVQLNAVKAISTSHKLIVDGRYPHTFLEDVRQSLQFLEALHTQALEQLLQHPEASKVPELVQMLSQRSVTNGQG